MSDRRQRERILLVHPLPDRPLAKSPLYIREFLGWVAPEGGSFAVKVVRMPASEADP